MKVNIGPYRDRWSTSNIERIWIKYRYPEELHWNVDLEAGDITDRVFYKLLDLWQVVLNLTINKITRKRKVKVLYNNYDTWNLDQTLALIILPGLKQLKGTNHGYGNVAEEDLSRDQVNDDEARWSWVMDEMIWAFENIDIDFSETKEHNERVQRGLTLFGKYFRSLWD